MARIPPPLRGKEWKVAAACWSKRRYRSKKEAKESARRFPVKLKTYRCPHCQGWHLAKR